MDQKPNSVRSIYIRSKSNEGVVVPITDCPGNNWVRVRGTESDAVQAALTSFYRDKTDKDSSDNGPFKDLGVIASMVSEWSFDEVLTPELLQEALVEVPSLKIAIVNASLERANFLPQRSEPSSDGLKSNSDSQADQQDQNKATAQP